MVDKTILVLSIILIIALPFLYIQNKKSENTNISYACFKVPSINLRVYEEIHRLPAKYIIKDLKTEKECYTKW